MPFVSGLYRTCPVPECDSTSLTVVLESWDDLDRIFVGEQRCDVCGARCLYSRRASTPGELTMAKKQKSSTRKKSKANGSVASHRRNTINSNGAPSESVEMAPPTMPVGEAMRRAVEALGDIVIDPDKAAQQLRQLSVDYEHVVEEQAAYDQKVAAVKVAKKSLESATELLLTNVKAFTHPAPLPLFDAPQAEADLDAMTDSATDDGDPDQASA